MVYLIAYSPVTFSNIKVTITGVGGPLHTELISNLSLARQENQDHPPSDAYVKSLYLRALTEIQNVLKSNGYYHAVISDALLQAGDNWIANFKIEAGNPIIIRNISIVVTGAGADDEKMDEVTGDFPLSLNDKLNHKLYEAGKKRIQNIARERGYFDAVFSTNIIHINEADKSATIDLQFATGVRYLIGEIIIPDTVVNVDVLNRLVPFKIGDPYDANLLIILYQRLRDSNYFNEVLVNPELNNISDYRVPVSVTLTPRPKDNIRIGLGYGTDSGPRMLAAWDSHYINSKGHRLETDLQISPTASALSGVYIMPHTRISGAELGLSSSLSREDTDTHTSNTFKLGAQQSQKRGSWNESISLTYQFESFEIADVDDTSNLLIPGVTYWKSVSDTPIYTNNGYRLNLNVRGSVRGVLSNLSFLQAIASAKYIHSIGADGRLIGRGELGATHVPEFNALPASIRFFAGGDNSIRGFDLQSLGPRDPEGNVIGGKYITVGSIEYEHRIIDKWSVAMFSDFGNAYDDFSDDFVYSAGAGIRWRTPVGLVRIDLAFGISEDPVPFRLHINIGPDL